MRWWDDIGGKPEGDGSGEQGKGEVGGSWWRRACLALRSIRDTRRFVATTSWLHVVEDDRRFADLVRSCYVDDLFGVSGCIPLGVALGALPLTVLEGWLKSGVGCLAEVEKDF